MNNSREYIIHCSVFQCESCRLDKYLADLVSFLPIKVSRTQIERMCKSMRVNGKAVKRSYSIQEKDELYIVLEAPSESEAHIAASDRDYTEDYKALDILFEDKNILVVNKPRGMVVHPGAGHTEGTLSQIVFAQLTSYREEDRFNNRAGIVHRLDKDTSGIIMVAKTAQIQDKLTRLFSQRKIEKKYLAIVKPLPKNRAESIKTYIGRHVHNRQKFCVVANEKKGRFAHTDYRIIANTEDFAVLLCSIHTGRTHQIRVHMQHIGCPIVGDTIYSRNTIKYKQLHANSGISSMRGTVVAKNATDFGGDLSADVSNHIDEIDCPLMLHAYEISFEINIKDEIVPYHIVAPIPDDMRLALEYMDVAHNIEDFI